MLGDFKSNDATLEIDFNLRPDEKIHKLCLINDGKVKHNLHTLCNCCLSNYNWDLMKVNDSKWKC